MRRCGSNAQAVPVRTHTTQRADAAACQRGPAGSFTCAQYPPPRVDVMPKPPAAHLQFSVGQIASNPRRITIVMDSFEDYWDRGAVVNATRPGMMSVTAVPERGAVSIA